MRIRFLKVIYQFIPPIIWNMTAKLKLKKSEKKYFGLNTSIFLILYGSLRFILEFLREPDSHIGLYFNLFTMGQFLCIPMIILGIIIFYIKNEFNKK